MRPVTIRFLALSAAGLLLAVGLISAPLSGGLLAQPAPTVDPFAFVTPVPVVFGTPTAPPALSGVAGYAERGAVAIRSGPGLEYRRIGGLAGGRSIDIIGYNGYNLNRRCGPNFAADLDMWVLVRFRGGLGWMARCALTIRGEQNMAQFLNNAPPPGSRPPTGYPITPTPGG